MSSVWDGLLEFLKDNQLYALPIAFAISMAESIVGISLFIPSTLILIASSSLLAASGADILTLWLAAGLGAASGDWISYMLGYHFEHRLHDRWPLKGRRHLVERGHAFFHRWGWASMFIARFMGPLRSLTPLIAGICGMPLIAFGLASLVSAMVWAGAVLLPGGVGGAWLLGR
jgi:membrane protein DedA with SNARE-associated domain